MILQALFQLYDRLSAESAYEMPPPGYSLQKITYKVVVAPDGTLVDIQDARVPGKPRPRPRALIVPGGGKPTGAVTEESVHKKVLLLRNDLPFLVGAAVKEEVDSRSGKKNRTLVCSPREFEAFRKFHLEIEPEIGDEVFSMVCNFLRSWDPAEALHHPEWADLADGQGVFQVLGHAEWVHDRPAVKAWWEARQQSGQSEVKGQCLITGESGPVARLHPMIKGVAGANTTGASLVGFNFDAVESYGKSQSFNAPVSEHAAFRYGTALNSLLDGPQRGKHTIVIGDSTVVFWTDRPTTTEDIFAEFAWHGAAAPADAELQDESVRMKLELFLRALRKGREAYGEIEDDPDRTAFFILGLSPNAARLSVRFFHRGTLGALLDNLRAHYNDIAVAVQPAKGESPGNQEFPPGWLLLDQTCPRKGGKPDRDKIPPILAGGLLRAIVTGAHYPHALFTAVFRRIRADGIVSFPRVCVIKGYLNRNLGREVSMALDTERQDPAYRLGRLFAALEKTQLDALGERLNATIRDRFYSAASATPGAVFPRLLRTYQHHLAKMEGGLKVNREKLVQEIVAPLSGFPAHLGLQDQGLFAVGYYHQTRAFYTSKNAKSDE